MSRSHDNITHLAGQKPDSSTEAVLSRIDGVVSHLDHGDLATILKNGTPPEPWSFIADARCIAELLDNHTVEPESCDFSTIQAAGGLIARLLRTAEMIDTWGRD